jgi:mRNA-degrading endonuclease RelE of RelBE toxin-antitoxin system
MISYETIPEFNKDFKSLLKRFKSLEKDFENMKKYTLEIYYEKGQPTTAFVPIDGFCSENYTSNKVRKFSCMTLKGRGAASGIRVIFVWEENKRKVTFIEMYFKGDKENENRERLSNFVKTIEKN